MALLVALLVLLTAGGGMAAAAAFESSCASSCCPSEHAPASDGSCPQPDCQCSSCLVMELDQPSSAGPLTAVELSWNSPIATLPLPDFVRAIEHPPKG
jgi:hypothetical protein